MGNIFVPSENEELLSQFLRKEREFSMLLSFPEKSDLPPLFDILNILSPQNCQITFALLNIFFGRNLFSKCIDSSC